MMRGYLDRMMRRRPREITLQFRELADPRFPGVAGFLVTPGSLTKADIDRLKSELEGRRFLDGETVKVTR
jgi:hypothetical protein